MTENMTTPAARSGRLTAVGIIAVVMALASGAYVVALGWSAAFLLSEGVLLAIYAVLVLLSPVLFTILAILAFMGRRRAALWVTGVLVVKWLAVFAYAVIDEGLAGFFSSLFSEPLKAFFDSGSFAEGDVFLRLIAIGQFDLEPLAILAIVIMLAWPRKK